MRLLLDECLDWRLLRDIVGHDVSTVRAMGWTGVKNGSLLALASKSFDVLNTVDGTLAFQQNVGSLEIGVVVLQARTSRLADLRSLSPDLLKVLPECRSGVVRILRGRS